MSSSDDAESEGEDEDKEGGGQSQERDWRAEGAKMEMAISLNAIKQALPLTSREAAEFAPPEGWAQHVESKPGKRKLEAKWIRQAEASAPGRPAAVEGREELEHCLEKEARLDGAPWMGTLHTTDGGDTEWQIRRRAADAAIEHVLSELVSVGLVRTISGEAVGKGSDLYCIVNRYVKGEPFPIQRSKKGREEEPEEEEELCDFELERNRNIERNKELLRQLGLA